MQALKVICFNDVLQVFKTLQDRYTAQTYSCRSTTNMSSVLPQPLPPKTPAWTDASVEALRSEFTKLGPQEDTYCCTQHVHVPSLSSMLASSGLQKVDRDKETLGMNSSQRFPCESDESQGFSQYLSSSDSSSVSKSNTPGTVWSQGDGDYSSWAVLSQTSSAAGTVCCFREFSLLSIKTIQLVLITKKTQNKNVMLTLLKNG